MNSIQIDCFLEAAKYRSFSVAASRLFVSQPTLSRNIATLERELGVTLFNRSSFHGIELTPAGRIMMESFSDAKNTIRQSLREALQAESSASVPLLLGLLQGQLLDDTLDDIIAAFKLEYPNVKISICRASYQALIDGLKSGDISVVCMPAWQFPDSKGLQKLSLCSVETILVVPKRLHPEVEDRVYSIKEFESYPFLSVDETECRHNSDLLRGLFERSSIAPQIFHFSSLQDQIHAVEMGDGVIVINPYNSICYSPTVHCVRVAELEPQPFAAAWMIPARSPGVRCFHAFAQQYSNMNK